MAHDLMKAIRRKVVLMDGGMGSMIIAAGMREGDIPESWAVKNPDKLMAIHAAYLEAGAEVIQTNTFGASRLKLHSSEAGAKLDPVEVNTRAAQLALKAAAEHDSRDRFVAGVRGVSEWTFVGTRASDGQRVEVDGCDVFTFDGDRIRLKDSYRKQRTG